MCYQESERVRGAIRERRVSSRARGDLGSGLLGGGLLLGSGTLILIMNKK